MPINIPDKLPAASVLEKENIFFITEEKAKRQDMRPLEIAIMNLMPDKITTETQILRRISNTPIQIELTLLHPKTHTCTHTPEDHLGLFYKHFDDVKNKQFDGLIITGAPVEHLAFENVNYWQELKQLMEWSKTNVTSTLHICWASQAGLFYHYGIPKVKADEKIFGVFPHYKSKKRVKLLRGFDDIFYVPQSRHTTVNREDILKEKNLEILADSEFSGPYIITSKDEKQIFVTGHSEYSSTTLNKEYLRDKTKGLDIKIPTNYFPENNPCKKPLVTWRGHSNLLFANWINYYVYQEMKPRLG